jgi:hypothetical protein
MTAEDKKLTKHKLLVTRVLEGDGRATPVQRRAAFDNAGLEGSLSTLVNKVARYAYRVTDEDINTVKVSGFSEDQIFELVVCAAIGQSTRQYESALAALDAHSPGIGSTATGRSSAGLLSWGFLRHADVSVHAGGDARSFCMVNR